MNLNIPAIPAFTLPPFMTQLGIRLPQWPHSVNLVLGLNTLRKMGLFPEEALGQLANRHFRVTVLDAGGVADFTYRNSTFLPLFQPLGTPDLHFTARLSAFLQLLSRQEDPDTLFFNRTLTIEGDTELGLIVKNMLDAIEWPSIIP